MLAFSTQRFTVDCWGDSEIGGQAPCAAGFLSTADKYQSAAESAREPSMDRITSIDSHVHDGGLYCLQCGSGKFHRSYPVCSIMNISPDRDSNDLTDALSSI